MEKALETQFVCINCLNPSSSLYTEYSRDVIRMTECKNCGLIVDKYIEYDITLIIIDLILQYKSAYRHVLINLNFKSFFRIIFIFLLCDAYEDWIERKSLADPVRIFYDLEWTFYECLLKSLMEFLVYSISIYLLINLLIQIKQIKPKIKKFLLKTNKNYFVFSFECALISFYGNLFIVFSIIWKLHGQYLHKVLTQSFLFISHLQIQKALYPEFGFWNILAILISILFQFIAGYFTQKYIKMFTNTFY
uniref:Protein ARV n=1 Tax=Meloidogyne enterolobii TaxID=390850 RepID=A0A6V7VXS3_MELEN|nr:unnamed protein product [Meloidogyne enterolobii]